MVKRAVVPLVAILALASAVAVPEAAQRATALAGSALDTGRVEFGLDNDPLGGSANDIGWMTGSGVPWKYRYHYLAGGVNTGFGWLQSWGPNWAYNYMVASTTSPAGYLPMFSYYQMCQSLPQTPGCGNDQAQDYNVLQNATTMKAYYGDFRAMLQQAGSYGKPVVIHVEPDLWGLMQQKAVALGQTTASGVPAQVKSSGFTDAHVNFGGFSDNFQSFACSLLMLRDAYAPNALMAIHASPWGSGIDIASDTNPAVNPVMEADLDAAFLNSSCLSTNPYGGSTWDLVFNDLDDHDAAYWEVVCHCTNAFFTHWWDPTNTTFPNFTRYLSWVAELKVKTARPQLAWQVPEGNQYFETEDNTTGHLQDDVAQYFIDHPSDLYNAGIIAVLFGSGNAGQTTNADIMGDGITNGPGHGTLDPATPTWCNACNTHVSTYADDDGGYLRIFVAQYYASHPLGRPPVAQAPVNVASGRDPVSQSAAGTSGPRVAHRYLRLPIGSPAQAPTVPADLPFHVLIR